MLWIHYENNTTIMIKKHCEIIESGKNMLEALSQRGSIPVKYTGKITLEININQGGITDVKVLPELRFK